MKENMRRLYLYNRDNGIDTITYVKESILSALNGQINDFKDLEQYMSQPARESALERLEACEHNPPAIEVTLQHHTLMNWETLR